MGKKRNAKKLNHGSLRNVPNIDDEGYEILGGGIGKEMAIGEVVVGTYGGIVREMPGKKRGTSIPFYQVGDRTLLGSTVLRDRFEQGEKSGKLSIGDTVRVTRVEDAPAKRGQNAAKVFEVAVKRAS